MTFAVRRGGVTQRVRRLVAAGQPWAGRRPTPRHQRSAHQAAPGQRRGGARSPPAWPRTGNSSGRCCWWSSRDHPVAPARRSGGSDMSSSDAIVIGEDWISEHYFTTDAKSSPSRAEVLERRKEWDDADAGDAVRSRFTAARRELEAALARPDVGRRRDGGRRRETPPPSCTLQASSGAGLRHAHEFGLTGMGPVLRACRAPGITEAAPLVRRRGPPGRRARRPARQGRRHPAAPATSSTRRPRLTSAARLLSTLFVDPTTAPTSRWCWPGAGRWSPSGSAGPRAATWPSTCNSSASATTTKRGGEIDRALTCLSARVPGAGRRRRASGGPTCWRSRSSTPSGSPRTCARASGCRSRSSPTRSSTAAAPRACEPLPQATRRSRWPSRRCGSCTGSCSCCTPRRPPSWACCRSARRSTSRATASTGCAT